jgi:magnesium chelatase family protein
VLIARAQQSVVFPAQFALVGAMNPCPCGFAGDPARTCACPAADILKHRSRVSGPLADRIDMTVHVPALPLRALAASPATSASAGVRARVLRARILQDERYRELPGVRCNGRASGRWIDAHTRMAADARALLVASAERTGLSARGFHRVLKVARTIADLDESVEVRRAHVAEAVYFRSASRVPPVEEVA